jgi:hypothetical protein
MLISKHLLRKDRKPLLEQLGVPAELAFYIKILGAYTDIKKMFFRFWKYLKSVGLPL